MFSCASKNDIFKFNDIPREKIADFGDIASIITNRNEFINRFCNAMVNNGFKANHGYVNYYDETSNSVDYWISLINEGMERLPV